MLTMCSNSANIRRSNISKFVMLVIVMTFCAMKVIIVDDLQDWGQETPRDVSRYILPAENSTILSPQLPDQKVDFLLVVTSDPRHVARRDAIRRTWGSSQNEDSPLKLATIFLMGLSSDPQVNDKVMEESLEHGDVLLENFVENYNNLTIKSLMMVKFVAQSNVNAEYIFKIDDDVFMNVRILSDLINSSKLSNKISGMMLYQRSPIRWAYSFEEKRSAWIVPKWMFPGDMFPDYVAGLGYIFPAKMSECLLEKSLETPLVHIEDIYLTGILAEKCGFEKGHIPGILKIPQDPCKYGPDTFIAHGVKPEDQSLMQELLEKRVRTKCDQRPRRSFFFLN